MPYSSIIFCLEFGAIHCLIYFNFEICTQWLRSTMAFSILHHLNIWAQMDKPSFLFLAGSQWQSEIWAGFHDRHSWQSHILPTNSCGSWPCAEQASYSTWNCLTHLCYIWGEVLWWLIFVFLMFFVQSFQHAKGYTSAPSWIGCRWDGKKSQSLTEVCSYKAMTHLVVTMFLPISQIFFFLFFSLFQVQEEK